MSVQSDVRFEDLFIRNTSMSGGFDVRNKPGELFMKPYVVALGEVCGLINHRVPMSTYWGSSWSENHGQTLESASESWCRTDSTQNGTVEFKIQI